MRLRLRFSIRDLFWFTALVAMGCAWWVDHRALKALTDNWVDYDTRGAGVMPAIPGKHIDQVKAHLENDPPADNSSWPSPQLK
jgi:hypothetical protein